ncbi:MAG TPA: endolytic transglycosylase MltG [Gemmatimonadaceae bacterium]|nr:endolytic transglycosylase MltG [Gemmatimonadaceae bacterium]
MRSRFHVRHRAARIAATAALAIAGACTSANDKTVRITIPPGSSFGAAVDSLERNGVISSPKVFGLYASSRGRDRELKAGTYVFGPGMSWGDVLDALTRGKGLVHTVTIPEGFALTSIAPLLGRALSVPPESVMVAAGDTALRHQLDIPTPTLEGYLFPDTYTFAEGTAPVEAVRVMVARFEQVWKPEWNARLQELAMSRNDIMALASIIEKEARIAEERPVISAVYHNRLKIGMLLQADPTVQYALGRHVDRVLYKDLEVDSRYNTYRHVGLPPGPIASPGAASIEAALYPANVPYLYFVAAPDGHHEFRKTFSEHTEARAQIRRGSR